MVNKVKQLVIKNGTNKHVRPLVHPLVRSAPHMLL